MVVTRNRRIYMRNIYHSHACRGFHFPRESETPCVHGQAPPDARPAEAGRHRDGQRDRLVGRVLRPDDRGVADVLHDHPDPSDEVRGRHELPDHLLRALHHAAGHAGPAVPR